MSITAVVENGSVKLPVHVPDGTSVEVVVLKESRDPRVQKLRATLLAAAGSCKGLPPDLAAEHDHYLHGTPKRRA